MDIKKIVKELLERKDRKKLLENTAIVAVIGIIVIIAGSTFLSRGSPGKAETTASAGTKAVETAAANTVSPVSDTEQRLKQLLSQMQGVGKVDVMITYASGKESIPATDVKKSESSTEEKDSGGGTRNITQSESDTAVVYEEGQGGDKKPVIVKELQPVVKGVVVVADGAGNPVAKERIIEAVRVLMDVPAHKVSVLERKKP